MTLSSIKYSNVPSFPSSYYDASSKLLAKTVSVAADRYTVQLPQYMDLDIGGLSYQLASQTYLDASADASWDFGQSIATWQPNTAYSEGQWVRVTSVAMVDGKFNGSETNVVPLMTADNSPSPFVASISSSISGYAAAYIAFSTILIPFASITSPTYPAYVQIDLGTSVIINKYCFGIGQSDRYPIDWTIQGSNNETDWTVLDTVAGFSTVVGYKRMQYFAFSNSTPYRYYRFNVTANAGGARFQISNLTYIAYQTTLHNFVYKCTSAGTSLLSEPTWGTTVGGTTTESGGPTWTCYYDTTNPSVRAGQDYYIYACQPTSGIIPKILLSSNATYPHGYTASNSRKIGGFHCLCGSVGTISNHPLTGYLTGDILPASVWCLKHRHASGDNRGMVYIEPLNKWAAIYNISGTQFAPVSAFGGTILDTITWYQGRDAASRVQMRLPTDAEFGVLAAGSNEATNILGSADPVTVTAAVDTAGRRMISNYGVESAVGSMKQFGDVLGYRFDAAAEHTHTITVTGDAGTFTSGNPSADVAPAWSYKAKTNYKGSLYTQGTTGLVCSLLGFRYSDGSNAGSLASDTSIDLYHGYATVGLRFIGNNLEK